MMNSGKSDPLSGFGQGLKLLREAAGLTQSEVAARTDQAVRKSQISAYENERARPSLESLASLLKALDSDFAELQRAIELGRNERQAPPSRLTAAVELRKDLRAGVDATNVELPAFLVIDLREVPRGEPERVARAVKDYVDLSRSVLTRVEREEAQGGPETAPAETEGNDG